MSWYLYPSVSNNFSISYNRFWNAFDLFKSPVFLELKVRCFRHCKSSFPMITWSNIVLSFLIRFNFLSIFHSSVKLIYCNFIIYQTALINIFWSFLLVQLFFSYQSRSKSCLSIIVLFEVLLKLLVFLLLQFTSPSSCSSYNIFIQRLSSFMFNDFRSISIIHEFFILFYLFYCVCKFSSLCLF